MTTDETKRDDLALGTRAEQEAASADVDAARAALLACLPDRCSMRGMTHTHNGPCPDEAHEAADALIAAVRAESYTDPDTDRQQLFEQAERADSLEAKLAALRTAAQRMSDAVADRAAAARSHLDITMPVDAEFLSAIKALRAALAATPAEEERT